MSERSGVRETGQAMAGFEGEMGPKAKECKAGKGEKTFSSRVFRRNQPF